MEKGTTKGLMLPIVLLTIATIALGLGAEGINEYIADSSRRLIKSRSLYSCRI